MTDQIPPSLQRFGVEFEQAARRELSRGPRARRFALAAAGSTAVAAIAAATVLLVGATSGAAPAYALTHNADGSITITLHNLTTGISQLNARLHQMGINETVVPVTSSCTTSTPVLDPGPGNLSETITIGQGNGYPAGVDGYLAAEQLPDGRIGLGIGGMKAPLPRCFSPAPLEVEPSNTPEGSNATAGAPVTSATTKSLPPLPVPPAVRRHLKAADAGMPPTSATTKSLPPTKNK
jgi:hypothetical protein